MNADTESISRQSAAARASLRRSWRRPLAPYLFLLPFLLVFAIFFLTPLLQSVVMSVRSYSGPRESHFVGTAHYQYLLQDKLFWVAVANTVSYTLLFLLFQVPMSLALAVALNCVHVRVRTALRLAMLLPFLAGNVLAAMLLTLLVAPRQGLINRAIALVWPTAELNWKSDPWLATAAIVLAVLWLTVGWGMMYLLAALQSVSRELYQAAEVDGASAWQRFRHVTLPGIRPVLAYLVLVGTVGGLQLFELPYLFFEGLGPRLRGLTVMQYLALSGFARSDLGMAAAVGWVLVLMITLATLPQIRRMRRGLK
ncbi:carbohydrate ABC transporter permease [Humisphaera borealis]|uniref:Sugar ABC transporter permease n=1 Tax=Humisphaera borealis TaxID=2807512 RepID=A0A7M2X1D1_9BACT|nr:sugar ABC transporter permease [Humisphaera borealis]QOV90931.1 sugar ABC transporter permease [Humisphaera borealis]